MFHGMSVRAWALAMAGLFVCAGLLAQDRTPTRFDLPAQPLADALKAVGAKANLNVLIAPALVDGRRAPALKATMTVDEAIAALLRGTGVTYKYLSERTITLVAEGAPVRISAAPAGDADIAQAGAASMQKVERETFADSASLSGSPEAALLAESKGIPEILVRGSRSANTGIRRSEDDAQPYVVFEAEQIEQSMASSLEEFLRARLPMNTRPASSAQQVNRGEGNVSTVNLRGLGTNQTLILVNGRRMPGIAAFTQSNAFEQPDINGIPLSAVERIEVLPSTASGIYGGGATGGVVNIVLKQDFSGVELRAAYENTFRGDVDQQRLDLTGGFSFGAGRTAVTFNASASQSGRLLIGERDFARRGRELFLQNDAASVMNSASPPLGYTTNIRSRNGSNLVLDGGQSLGSPFTSVPVGYAGVHTDGGAALLANAARYNLDLPADLSGALGGLTYSPRVRSAMLGLRQRLGARIEGFVDLSASDNDARSDFISGNDQLYLPADIPGNPFTTEIVVRFPMPGVTDTRASLSRTLRGTAGLTARLGRGWSAQAEYNRSRASHESRATSLNSSADLRAGLGYSGVTYLDPTLNPLRDLNLYPFDFSAYRIASPSEVNGPFHLDLENMIVRAGGTVLALPAGPLSLTLQIERREERASGGFSRRLGYQELFGGSPDGTRAALYYPPRWQRAAAAYAEATVPLVSGRNGRRWMNALEAQLSLRSEAHTIHAVPNGSIFLPEGAAMPVVQHVRSELNSTDGTFGLRYVPVESLALRASYGTGFLPPSISQMFPSILPRTQTLYLRDPKRGNVEGYVGPLIMVTGGNPYLGPESSTSWSAGAIYTPAALQGLRLSLDYTRIEKTGEIASLTYQGILDAENQLPGRIERGPLTQEDIDRGYTAGPVTRFDASLLNLAGSRVKALDMQADYRWSAAAHGKFHLYALVTYQGAFERRTTAASAPVNEAGYSNAPLKWRGNAGLNWERGPWALGWSVQFYDSHWVYPAVVRPEVAPAVAAIYVRQQGSSTIPRQVYHDLFVQHRFGRMAGRLGLLSDVQITFGIQNLFDTEPPIVATSGTSGGYSFYGDPRLRRYALTLKKSL